MWLVSILIIVIYRRERYFELPNLRFINGVHVVFHNRILGVMECVMHQQLEIDQLNLMLILLDIINYVIANRVQMLHFVMAHTGKTVDEFQDK